MNVSSRGVMKCATAIAAVASLVALPRLPERVAMHFDLDGRPDRFGSRLSAAVTLPALVAALIVANDRIGAWPGAQDRDEPSSGVRAREQAMAYVSVGLSALHLALLAYALGLGLDIERVSRAIFALLMIGLGNVMPRLPRNSLMGIRTPWSVADPGVWERTHRLGGYLCTAAGVLGLASLVSRGRWAARVPFGGALAAAALSTAYSAAAHARRDRFTQESL